MSKCRLIQGDCLEEMDKLIRGGQKVDLILCDLPYGTTQCNWDSIVPFKDMWERINQLVYDKTPVVLFSHQPFTSELVHSNLSWFKHEWIYQKKSGTNIATYKYCPAKVHENVEVFCKTTPNYYPIKEPKPKSTLSRQKYAQKGGGNLETNTVKRLVYEPNSLPNDRYPQSVRKINNLKPSDRGLHPTQKPIELLEYFINTYSKQGDTVLDFTMGSGSTGVACLQTNRNFIGIELDEKYYNIAKKRCSNYQSKLM